MITARTIMEAPNQDQYDKPPPAEPNRPSALPSDTNGPRNFGWDKLSHDPIMQNRAIDLNNNRRALQMDVLILMLQQNLGNFDNLLTHPILSVHASTYLYCNYVSCIYCPYHPQATFVLQCSGY